MSFSQNLLQWYQKNKRDLPWRDTRDAYLIWLSEVILQQTRVAQGLSYYHAFASRFPRVQDLAEAPEGLVLRMWQGLGYYSRARNLHKAARIVVEKYGGVFPTEYAELLCLPGIGEYTAAAIASFSVGAPQAVLDGNVYRVLSRVFGVTQPINTPEGKRVFSALAAELLDRQQAGNYNQAIMEFGALQCTPKAAGCANCPLLEQCYAAREDQVSLLPVKLKAAKRRDRYFNYFVIQNPEGVLLKKRPAGDIWQHLYDFPLIEAERPLSQPEVMALPEFTTHFGREAKSVFRSREFKHILSHQTLLVRFMVLENTTVDLQENSSWNYVLIKDLDKLAKPKLMVSFINEYFSS